jgi:hydrogenase expression/formation protein HypD
VLDSSGFKIRDEYGKYNIENIYPLEINKFEENSMCQCGKVLKGIIKPEQCNLFKEICTPENPIGPCMVSVEGSCAAYYKYY